MHRDGDLDKGRVVLTVMLLGGAILFLLPLLWMFSTSLKPPDQLFDERWIPRTVRLKNYPEALAAMPFWRYTLNTLWICLLGTLGSVVSNVLVAYAFAFFRFPLRNVLFGLTLATMMIPFPITMVPLYGVFRDLGWIGSARPLWAPSYFGNAFFIFMLRQFFLRLPKDLMDAARIDGCSELEVLWHVVVPLSKPAIAMVALFHFLGSWKDFLGPLLYLNHQEGFTLSLGLQVFQSQHGGTSWHHLMAASAVVSMPLIILFFLTVKTFIRGIAVGAIKG